MSKHEALHQKFGKANFELVYGLEDPREYLRTLGKFDYCILQHGQRVFSSLIEARREEGHNGQRERQTGVVDVCCSYRINTPPSSSTRRPSTTSTRATAPRS